MNKEDITHLLWKPVIWTSWISKRFNCSADRNPNTKTNSTAVSHNYDY